MAQTPSFAAKKSADGTPPLIRLENICKSYGPVRANRNISLEIRSGEILALLGENGAGKSTLMSILSGKSRQDSGTIFVDGLPSPFRSPRDALAAGIGMVYQHFMLVEAMTVTQNLMLGQAHGILNPAAMRARVLELAERYGFEINPDAMISDLSMGERQRVEILKLLYRDCRVLILDEPTAVLTPPEISQLFSALRRMAADGKAIVFISHKMKEVLDLATEISILRRGEIVEHFLRSEVPGERELADTVRLHILANSDTWDDQLLKLQVRDAVLAALPPAVTQAQSPQQAVRALQTALPVLQAAADSALHRAHSPQTAALRLESHNFSARDYGSFALPGGEYTALRIELGTAQGRNWFCVLYPSLCISGSTAAYPGADENALVFGRFEVRLAVADFIGRLASPAGEAVSGLPAD